MAGLVTRRAGLARVARAQRVRVHGITALQLVVVWTALLQEGQRESERPPGSERTPVAARPGRLRLVRVKAQVICRMNREVVALEVGQRDVRKLGFVSIGASPKASALVLGRAVRAPSRLGYVVC